MNPTIIIIVIVIMLVVGVVFALVWWHMADVLFPGTARKTGQGIFRGRKPQAPPPTAMVIKDFGESKPGDAGRG